MPTFWAHRGGNPNPKTPGSSVPTALVKGHVACWNWKDSLILKLTRQPWWFLNRHQGPSSFFWRLVHVRSWRALWFTPVGYKKFDGLPWFPLIFLSSNPIWQCFCWYKPISIPSFCWDGSSSLWVTPKISLSTVCPATPLVFFSEQALSLFFFFFNMDRLRIFPITKFWFFSA